MLMIIDHNSRTSILERSLRQDQPPRHSSGESVPGVPIMECLGEAIVKSEDGLGGTVCTHHTEAVSSSNNCFKEKR